MKSAFLFFVLLISTQLIAQDSSVVFQQKRQVQLQGGSNFRDLGGYPTLSGKTVSWEKIYRSADISKLTDADLSKLSDLHIATVCDLRGPSEIERGKDKLLPNMNYLNFPAGSENLPSSMSYFTMNTDSLMQDLYSRTDYLKAKYTPLFDELLKLQNNQSILYHCTAGKDRTGMATALILSALGVDRKYIVADYAATNIYWKNTREKMSDMMQKYGMAQSKVEKMLAADPIYIETFLKTIDEKFGSMDNFLEKEIGLTPDKISKLREMYLN